MRTTAAAVNEVSASSALAIGTARAAVMDLGTSARARAATPSDTNLYEAVFEGNFI